MSKIIYHIHHIVPRYRCKEIGIDPDFPENLIRLTRLEHGQAHYERWLKFKDNRDLTAAQLLAQGEIDGIDITGKNNPMYGKKHSPEARKKIRKSQIGHIVTEKTRKKISKANSGKNHPNYGLLPEATSMYGKKHSLESKKKMSEAKKGKKRAPHTEETKKKIGIAHKGKVVSEETREKMSKARKGKIRGSYNTKTTKYM